MWYPIQTCPKCKKTYDPIEKLSKCPICKVELEVRKPRLKKDTYL